LNNLVIHKFENSTRNQVVYQFQNYSYSGLAVSRPGGAPESISKIQKADVLTFDKKLNKIIEKI